MSQYLEFLRYTQYIVCILSEIRHLQSFYEVFQSTQAELLYSIIDNINTELYQEKIVLATCEILLEVVK